MDTVEIKKLEGIIEAVLFAMGDSVELGQIALAIEHDEETTRKIIHQMMDRYETEDRGIRIIELEDAFQMCTKKEMYEYLIRVAKQPKKYVLTDVLLETLSIIAYKQPVTKLEIEKIRGVKSDHAVNKLVEYDLVYEVGRLDAPGKPILFGTTEEFLRRFSIQSADDLPTLNPEQVENLLNKIDDLDPSWNQDQLDQRIEETYYSVQKAWSKKDLSTLQKYLSPPLYDRWLIKLNFMDLRHEENVLKNIQLLDHKIVSVHDFQENEKDSFWVYIKGKMIDYTVDMETREIKEGSTKPSEFIEYWRFLRDKDTFVLDEIAQKEDKSLDVFTDFSENNPMR